MPKLKLVSSISSILAMLGLGFLVLVFYFMMNSSQRLTPAQANRVDSGISSVAVPTSQKSQPIQKVIETKLDATSIFNGLKGKTTLKPEDAFWVQLIAVTKNDHDSENNGQMEDGSILPKEYVEEQWIFVDADLNQIKGLYIQNQLTQNDAQNSLQTDVMRIAWDTTSAKNLLTNERLTVEPNSAEKFSIPNYGFQIFPNDFVEELPATNESGKPIKNTVSATKVEFTILNGRKVALFTTNSLQDTPTQFGSYKALVVGMTTKGYFDLVSGHLVRTEQILLFADGSTRVASTLDLTINFLTEPTAQVLTDLSLLEASK